MDSRDNPVKGAFNERFLQWVHETVGISRELLLSLKKDDDWTFIIKMHGILEAALNHLILSRLDPKAASFVSHLETNDRRTGKIALIKAYGLLSDNACLFVRMLSEVRNRAVHDIKNFDLDILKYLEGLDKNQRQNWSLGLTSWMVSPPTDRMLLDSALKIPRIAIYNACMGIMIQSFHARPGWALEAYQEILRQESQKLAESNPTGE